MLAESFSWTSFGTALAMVFFGFMQVWQARQAKKTAAVVDTIHTLTNSKMGEELFTGMVAAKAVLQSKDSEENRQLFRTAEKKYLDHQAKQSIVDKAKT